jgi:hypothetical protein
MLFDDREWPYRAIWVCDASTEHRDFVYGEPSPIRKAVQVKLCSAPDCGEFMTLEHHFFEFMGSSTWVCGRDPNHREVVWVSGPPLPALPTHEPAYSQYPLGSLFHLSVDRRRATALVFSHERGWEVRLVIAPAFRCVRVQVCTTEDEVFECGAQWKRALMHKGWR